MELRQNGDRGAIGGHMLRGSAWTMASRWSIRLLGFVSTLILARLLSPQDFGVVAIAMLVVGFLEIFAITGQRLAIIRHDNPTRELYDTAWTISILIGFLIAAVILSIAPFTESYFQESRSVLVMQILALRAIISGFENIGTVDFARELQFDRNYKLKVYSKILAFVATVTFAVLLRNYWALVVSMILLPALEVALSYRMHSYRPRLSLAAVREIWSFSFWIFLKSIGRYISEKVDLVVIGGVTGTASLGTYTVARDVSSMPTAEVNAPMVSVLYPVMARVKNDLSKMRDLYLQVFSWSAIICSATASGIALVSQDFVTVILGPRWMALEPLVIWLAFSAGLTGLTISAYSVFDMLGVPRIGARLQWTRAFFLVASIAPVAYVYRDIEMVAIVRLVAIAIFVPTLLSTVAKFIHISPSDFVACLWRPVASALVMAAIVLGTNALVSLDPALRLAVNVGEGAVSYASCLLVLWHISGRPNSPETAAIDFIRHGARPKSDGENERTANR